MNSCFIFANICIIRPLQFRYCWNIGHEKIGNKQLQISYSRVHKQSFSGKQYESLILVIFKEGLLFKGEAGLGYSSSCLDSQQIGQKLAHSEQLQTVATKTI